MEPIILDLRPDSPRIFQKWFGAIVVLYLLSVWALMVTSLIPANAPMVLTSILLLLQVVVNWFNSKPLRVTFDTTGIKGEIRTRRPISLPWDQIAQIDVHMFAMDVHTNAGQIEQIDLSAITYEQHKTIKPRIMELAKSKGIDLRAA